MTTPDWIQSVGLFLAFAALLITVLNNRRQLKILQEQMRLNSFMDYTKRYQEIILHFPEDVNLPNFSIKDLPGEERKKLLKYMRAYFDLCSEEYDMYLAGYVEERVWKNWQEGIEHSFSKRAYKEAWEQIALDSVYYPKFTAWIKKLTGPLPCNSFNQPMSTSN